MESFQPTKDNISIIIETVNIFNNDSLFTQMGKMCQEYIWKIKAYVHYIVYNEFAFDDYNEYIKNEDSIENIIKATRLKKIIDEMTKLMKYYYNMAIDPADGEEKELPEFDIIKKPQEEEKGGFMDEKLSAHVTRPRY